MCLDFKGTAALLQPYFLVIESFQVRVNKWFLHLDDEINPKDVDKDKSVSFGEESPRAKHRVECRSKGIQGAAYQTV